MAKTIDQQLSSQASAPRSSDSTVGEIDPPGDTPKMATTAGCYEESLGFVYESKLPTWHETDPAVIQAERVSFPKDKLPAFVAHDEETYEEWADVVRDVVRRFGAHVGEDWLIFQLCLLIPSDTADQAQEARIRHPKELNAFMDDFALRLYPESAYAQELFQQLLTFKPADLPVLGKLFRAKLTRYVRVSQRWKRHIPLPTFAFSHASTLR